MTTTALPLGDDRTDPVYGGVLACAAVNAVEWRRSEEPFETWTSYAKLLATVSAAQPLAADAQLLERATADPAAAELALGRAVALRETLLGVLSSAAAQSPPDLSGLNPSLKQALRHLTVTAGADGTFVAALDDPLDLNRPLWQIALSAAALLTGDQRPRLKQCPGEKCGWLFVDASKNRSRRWCDPNQCGNRDKVRAHYWRQKAES